MIWSFRHYPHGEWLISHNPSTPSHITMLPNRYRHRLLSNLPKRISHSIHPYLLLPLILLHQYLRSPTISITPLQQPHGTSHPTCALHFLFRRISIFNKSLPATILLSLFHSPSINHFYFFTSNLPYQSARASPDYSFQAPT